jgi:hypothetical protein
MSDPDPSHAEQIPQQWAAVLCLELRKGNPIAGKIASARPAAFRHPVRCAVFQLER